MRELTALQQETYDLREKEGKRFREIAELQGKSISSVNDTYRLAKMKVEGLIRSQKDGHSNQAVENTLPVEKAVALMDAITDPFKKLVEAAKECGMKPSVVEGLARRMRTRYLGVTDQMRAIKTKDMIVKIDERIGHALNYLDDYVMADAGFRDLAMGVGILIEKRQLLRGEPTQIISVDERASLNKLLPMLVEEARRRGITIDVRAERVVEPSA